MNVDEFREYLKIDKLGLDINLSQQPSLLFAVSEACEQALALRDKLKDDIGICEANLDLTYRQTMTNYTEGKIKSLVLTDKARRSAITAYNNQRAKAGQLLALKDAFKERGYMLREMCSLYVSNYFERNSSRPTVDTDTVAYNQRKAKIAAVRRETT